MESRWYWIIGSGDYSAQSLPLPLPAAQSLPLPSGTLQLAIKSVVSLHIRALQCIYLSFSVLSLRHRLASLAWQVHLQSSQPCVAGPPTVYSALQAMVRFAGVAGLLMVLYSTVTSRQRFSMYYCMLKKSRQFFPSTTKKQ